MKEDKIFHQGTKLDTGLNYLATVNL